MKKSAIAQKRFDKRKAKRLQEKQEEKDFKLFRQTTGATSRNSFRKHLQRGPIEAQPCNSMKQFHQANGTFSRCLWIHFAEARKAASEVVA